ncbi:restriction endonuclease subunit S [Pontiella agarivorans]|uniref:Restriction endonuclease subunit S n=1 Tax=Pontiella agarivorans TaxID=3038953 RepID=A0ABU5MVF3_9BACT|nr:restriction endonuclease subunit S [Pontiella agarivorans]MDZ8118182.1 restriction endonuclease subunit S [Pontiella agarivorans]
MSDVSMPEGWAISKLSDAIAVDGVISDGDWVESKDQDPNGDVRLIQLADIGDGDFRNKSKRFMTPESADRLNCTYLEKGDVLIARMPDPLGRACLFPGVGQKAVTVVDVCLIRTGENSAFSNDFLKYWINTPDIRNLIEANASGTTRKRITRKKLEAFEYPLPPLAEQKEIALRLDDLLAQVDSIKTRLDGLPAILKRFRQSTLAAATSGKLTEEWREENSGNDSLREYIKDLEASRFEHWKKMRLVEFERKGKTPADDKWLARYKPVRVDEGLQGIPDVWEVERLDFIADVIDPNPKHRNPRYFDKGFHFISTAQFDGTDGFDLSKCRFVAKETIDEQGARCRFDKRSIAFSRKGTIGHTRILELDIPFALLDSLCVINCDAVISNKYLNYVLRGPLVAGQVVEKTKGVALKQVSVGGVRELLIPLPSVEEQTEIVRRVEELFAFADQVEQRVKEAQAHVNHLTQSILAKAFRGELTEQWRRENPDLITGENSAAALLQRIKTEREKLTPKKKPRKRRSP